jgi:uncharacterized SAM-binding protein YcdF (DUF218 family)
MISTREAITQLLFVRDEPAPVDLAIVLGSKYPTTMDPAIALYRLGWAPKILITGHGPREDQEKEALLFSAYAVEQGVEEADILLEVEARNTLDNMLLSMPIVEAAIGWDAIRRVSITCKPFHARRALMTALHHWPAHLEYLLLPSDDLRDIQPHDWWANQDSHRRVMDEVRRIGEYAVRGHLSTAG